MTDPRRRQTLSDLLENARARINRLDPAAAYGAMARGTLLVDIRSQFDRERDGVVSGSLHIPRTVLEWRLDPESELRNPYVGGLDQPVLLICDHGFSSVLAAATLTDLGFTHVGDVIGGFAAWREAGLPTSSPRPYSRDLAHVPGMGPPEP